MVVGSKSRGWAASPLLARSMPDRRYALTQTLDPLLDRPLPMRQLHLWQMRSWQPKAQVKSCSNFQHALPVSSSLT